MKQKNFLKRVVAPSVMTLMLLLHAGMAKAQTPYAAVWCEGNTTLYFSYSGELAAGDTYDGQTVTNVWPIDTNLQDHISYARAATRVVFENSFRDCLITDCSFWFEYFSNLQSIQGLSNLNTSNVTTMRGMFNGCSSLTSLDLSCWDTSAVTRMDGMFANCSSLSNLNLTGFDTHAVTNMDGMFMNCSNLTSLDVSFFDTSNVIDMNMMFYMTGLKTINVDNFDVSNVINMIGMFAGSANLQTIYCTKNWSSISASGNDLFTQCSDIIGEQGTTYDSSNVGLAYAHPDEGSTNPGYFTSFAPYVIWTAGNSTLTFLNSSTPYQAGDSYNGETITAVWSGTAVTNSGESSPGWHGCTPTTVVFDESFSIIRPTSCYQWFHGFSNLPVITGLENLNTSHVTTMHEMFEGCSSLTSLDLSHFDTSNVTSLWDTFKNCDRLSTLDVSSFNTSKVTNMWATFYSCDNLESIVFGEGFDTSNVTEMESMFGACPKLTTLDLTHFNTSKVHRMFAMFAGDKALRTLNVSSFNTENVTDMYGMFALCDNLQLITFGPQFVTTNVRDMGAMFAGSYSLVTLDLSTFDTRNVLSFSGEPVDSYTSLAQTDFDESGFPSSAFGMFSNCASLKTIYCKNDWSSSTATDTYMFYNCQSLVGGLGTAFNSSIIDKSYARPDVPGTSGYFTVPLIAQAIWTPGNNTLTFIAKSEEEVIAEGSTFNGFEVTSVWNGIAVIGTGEEATSETITLPGWNSSEIETVVFDPSFQYVRPKTCAGWFSECSNLTNIVGIENLNTSETLDMKYMFRFCTSLTSLDLHTLDTSNVIAINQLVADCYSLRSLNIDINTSGVTDMSGLFAFCRSLQSLTFTSRFDTSKVTNMGGMFAGCENLTYLDLSSFDTSNVTEMAAMFAGCTGLTALDLTGFDVSKVTSFHAEGAYFGTYMDLGIFTGCSNLTTIFCGDDWKTASLVPAADFVKSLFDGCTSLVGGMGTTFDTTEIDMNYAHPDAPGNPGYFTMPLVAQVVWTPGNSTLTFIAKTEQEVIAEGSQFNGYTVSKVWSGTQVTNTGSSPGWRSVDHDAVHVVFDESFSYIRPTSCRSWFDDFINVEDFTDLKYLNTSEVTDMSFMFYMIDYDSKFTSLDVSHFDTSKVTTMRSMFNGCNHVTSLDLSNFDTSNVTNMRCMFQYCSAVSELDLSSFNTSQVVDMYDLFGFCYNVESITFGQNFDTSNVSSFMGMFNSCYKLTDVDVSEFNTSNVTDMMGMFAFCQSLTDVDVSGFDTQNVTNMSAMFANCTSLTTLDLTNFDTSSVTEFHTTPSGDYAIVPTAVLGMFSGCSNLTTIFCGDDWNSSSVTDSDYMFYGCMKLVGGYGTEFDSSHMDVTYAHPDAEVTPGYFTLDTEVITGNKPGDKDTYWTTYYYSPTTTYVAPADGQEVSVYIAKMEEVGDIRQLILTKVEDGNIKAGQGVILESNQPNITMKHSIKREATDDSYETNELKGFDFTSAVPSDEGTIYTMGNVGGQLGFYKLKATVTELKGRKAYLAVPQGGDAPLRFFFDGTATGIEISTKDEVPSTIYDLSGRRVSTPTKGLYIVNGKKVFIK